MPDPITHVRGDTFSVSGQFTGGSYAGWTGRSQVRDDLTDELLSELTFIWVNAAQGLFTATALSTPNWPANKFVIFDVEVTSPSGEVRSSALVKILVERDATYAAG